MRRVLAPLGLAAVLALSVAASFVAADTPKASIVGPTTAVAGSSFALDGRGAVSDKPIKWSQTKGPSVGIVAMTPEGGPPRSFVLVYPNVAGLYEFKQVAIGTPKDATDIDADAALFSVTVTTNAPAPSPDPIPDDDKPRPKPPVPPTPGPSPDPAPAPGPVTSDPLDVSLVVDTASMTPALAEIRDSITIADAVAPYSASWHTFAMSAPLLDSLNYRPLVASAGGPPALVIVNKANRKATAVKCPPTEAEVVQLVAKMRGK